MNLLRDVRRMTGARAVYLGQGYVIIGWTLVVLALGEMTQSARYYDYISRLAPSGQQGLYMGCAFLPIAIGLKQPVGAILN